MELQVISVKVSKPLYALVKKYLELDAHVTKSDFVRDAIRQKLKNDAPWLLEEMFKNEGKRSEKRSTWVAEEAPVDQVAK